MGDHPVRAIALMSSGDGGLARVARHGQKLLAGLHVNLPGSIQNQSFILDQLANVLPRPPLQLAVLLASYKSLRPPSSWLAILSKPGLVDKLLAIAQGLLFNNLNSVKGLKSNRPGTPLEKLLGSRKLCR